MCLGVACSKVEGCLARLCPYHLTLLLVTFRGQRMKGIASAIFKNSKIKPKYQQAIKSQDSASNIKGDSFRMVSQYWRLALVPPRRGWYYSVARFPHSSPTKYWFVPVLAHSPVSPYRWTYNYHNTELNSSRGVSDSFRFQTMGLYLFIQGFQ